MAFRPDTIYADRDGRRVRLYADPQNVLLDSELRPIDSVLSVVEDAATDAVTVRLGKESITLVPKGGPDRDAIRGCRTKNVLETRHFGPVIEMATLSKKALAWRVLHSKGVKRVVDGWEFTEAKGARLGLYFDRWLRQFEGRIVLADDGVALDLDGVTGDRRRGMLNLDPETVYVSTIGVAGRDAEHEFDPGGAWNDAYSGNGETYDSNDGEIENALLDFGGPGPYWASTTRLCMNFDTSAYADPDTAVLHMTSYSWDQCNPTDTVITDAMAIANAKEDFEDIESSDKLGNLQETAPQNYYINILAEYDAVAALGFGAMLESEPDLDTVKKVGFEYSGDYRPRILLEGDFGGGAHRMMMMGIG